MQCASSVMSSCLSECALTFDLLPIPFLPCPCVGDIWTLLCQTLETKPSLTKVVTPPSPPPPPPPPTHTRLTSSHTWQGFWELLSDLLQPLLHPPTEHAQNLGTSEPAQNEFAGKFPFTGGVYDVRGHSPQRLVPPPDIQWCSVGGFSASWLL